MPVRGTRLCLLPGQVKQPPEGEHYAFEMCSVFARVEAYLLTKRLLPARVRRLARVSLLRSRINSEEVLRVAIRRKNELLKVGR